MALLCIYKVMTIQSITEGQRRLAFGRRVGLRSRAFTLIEVVLAVAIVSFSLLAIVGLLPIGLASVRDSENDQAIGAIATQLRGQLQQISFDTTVTNNINQLPNSVNQYSSEGLLITSTVPTNIAPYYRASFALTPSGIAGSKFTSDNSWTVVVTLNYPAPVYNQTTTFALLATSQTGHP